MHPTLPLLARTDFPRLRRQRPDEQPEVVASLPCCQMLGLSARVNGSPRAHLCDLLVHTAVGGAIRIADHCDGRTAGQGSCCGAALATSRA